MPSEVIKFPTQQNELQQTPCIFLIASIPKT